MNNIRIHWDKDYGFFHRKGWSIAIDGCFIVELEKFLIVAIVKTIKRMV